ncbi:MAG: flagellar motor switch protein FliN [Planctomycetaceae bacterium]|nr:flagellar motor switch protein FliN [Planctomycetaceae bacterium]
MSDGNTIDQSDVEKLLAAKSGNIERPTPESEVAPLSSTVDQSDVEKLLAAKSGNIKLPTPESEVAPLSSAIDQSDVEKLLAAKSGNIKLPTPESEVAPLSSAIDQGDIEKLLAGGTTGENSAKPVVVASPPATPAPPSDESNVFGQNDIENLLKNTIGVTSAQPKTGAGIGMPHGVEDEAIDEGVPQGDIDYLLRRAEEALESITSVGSGLPGTPPEVIEFQFPEFGGSTPNSGHATLDQISEVELDIKIELGRTNMYLEDILKLRRGSVVALDKIAGDAVDIYVNERLIARGEVLVLNDNFCVRVAELLAGAIPIE